MNALIEELRTLITHHPGNMALVKKADLSKLLAVVGLAFEAREFIQPFNSAAELYERIDKALAALTEDTTP